MAVGAKTASAPPSLQRLLSLDKSFDTIDQRVHEAARVLGISLQHEASPTSSEKRIIAAHPSRHEFVIRWLLEKLKTQPVARGCPHAWSLLFESLVRLPSPVLSKAVSGAGLLSLVSQTLCDLFPTGTAAEVSADATEDRESAPTPAKGSKKRKRNDSVKDLQPDGRSESPPPLADCRQIFLTIAETLRLLLDRADQPDSRLHAPVHSQIRSALTLDSSSFAILLKHWLTALFSFASLEHPTVPPEATLFSFALKLVSDLLSLQSSSLRSNDGTTSFDLLFCRECLSPAALLLARLHTTSGHSQSIPTTTSIQLLERLLAQQLFVPARAAFHATTDNAVISTTKSSSPRTHVSLTERLESFRTNVANLAHDGGRNIDDDATLSTGQKALPYLLDVGLRCTPTSSPRQRITEGPWIDVLFIALSDALPRSVSLLDDGQASTPNTVLAEMLDVMLSRKLSLTSELLIKLVKDWSDLLRWGYDSLPHAGPPDFNLVSKALTMDATIFTDPKSTRSKALFQALTAHGQVAENDTEEISSKQRLLCTSIAVPLMKAYARVRNLGGFIDQWLLQLQKDSSWQLQSWSIWTDSYLRASLHEVLEASLTLSQIADKLESCRLSMLDLAKQRLDGHKVPKSIVNHASASAVVLDSMISALHSDSAIDFLQTAFQSTIDTAQDMIHNLHPKETALTMFLLTALSRLYTLWFPVWSSTRPREEVEARLEVMVESPAIKKSMSVIELLSETAGDPKAQKLEAQQVTADAAFTLVATICDVSRAFPLHIDSVRALLNRAILPSKNQTASISTGYAALRPAAFYSTIASFPHLLDLMQSDDRKTMFQKIVQFAAEDSVLGQATSEAFVHAVVSVPSHAVRDELFTAISACLDAKSSSETERTISEKLLLQWSPKGLPRQQRESLLDLAVEAVLQRGDNASDLRPRLSLMVNLLELPNATAKIAIDPSIVWQLASVLSEEDQGGLALDLFEEICRLVFKHIVDNKEQKRSAAFLTSVSESMAALMEAKQPLQFCTGQLRLLSAFIKATEGRLDEAALAELSHRSSSAIDSLAKRLYQTLSTSLEHDQDIASSSQMDCMSIAVRVYNSLPESFLVSGGSSSSKYTKRFTKLLDSLLGISGLRSGNAIQESIPLSLQVESYRRLAPVIVQEDAAQLCEVAGNLLLRDLDASQHSTVLEAFSASTSLISDDEKLSLIRQLLTPVAGSLKVTAEKVGLVRCLISSLQSPKDPDEAFLVGILTSIPSLLRDCIGFDTHCELVDCVIVILRNKPTLVTQYGVEMTVATLVHLTTPSSSPLDARKAHTIFEGLCDITRSLLQFHRPSLGGRYHVFIPLLERLLACLFTPASRDSAATSRFKHPPWIDNKQHPLTSRHAQRVSRLLENLCNPPQSDISKRRPRENAGHEQLVDMTRKTRMQVGKHVQHVLHYFCTLVLNGRLGEGMRDALTPGLWAVMDVMEMGADESKGVKALSASMNNAERAILRGVFEDWRRFGSWSG